MPEVSVIIPNYNHARFLDRRIRSVLEQRFSDLEVILLDDRSTDNSAAVFEKYRDDPRVTHIVINPVNSGSPFAQWKKGIALAKGRYIWIAESDDFCDPDFLSVALAALKNGARIFYAKNLVVDEQDHILGDQLRWYADLDAERWKSGYENDCVDELARYLFFKNTITNASGVVFALPEKWEQCLDEVKTFRYAGDWYFWLFVLAQGGRITYSTATQNYFRSASGKTRIGRVPERNRELLAILRFIFNNPLSHGHRQEIADYFFEKHLFIPGRKKVSANLSLALQLVRVYRGFAKRYARYYRTGR